MILNRRLRGLASALAVICLARFAFAAEAVEPWADERLPLADSIELWLDAGRQNAARQSQGLPPLADRAVLERWLDGSGHKRHVQQPNEPAQPALRRVGETFVVRFDGLDDHLQRSGIDRELEQATIFLVACPYSNPGDFRGFLAANRTATNDYVSGFTIDQGGWPSQRFEIINPEGVGFGGARDVMSDAFDFGTFHTIAVTCGTGEGAVTVHIDGRPNGARDRQAAAIRMDQLTVGARFYNNAGAADTRGFLEGDLAEVLVYGRALDDAERQAVERYLAAKYAPLWKLKLDRPAPVGGGRRLVSVECPPVQMLVPGFTVRELPVELTNINTIKYRADGKLVALAYNGNIHLLSDSDGDGIEDRAGLFWENTGQLRGPIGMDLTPPGYAHGEGVFVASKGKCSLFVDTDGDDRADREIVIASGWTEIPQNVDAVGVAFDRRDGSVFFGLGTANFANPYLIDETGKSNYRIESERGTILRVAPDFKNREIVCTGVRFPVALAFNRHGDLFCTDQEGATWLPNGNPLDELLHIEKGRHYGFPPRHPRHLPDVIDEPSVFDYAPQHQSTCGLNFNDPVHGGPVFGPELWAGDALVCGESRGKLYRTKLVRTDAGYVAQTQQIAALNMLTIDACVSPAGDLAVAVHSGGPDWGTGPSGIGRLYKIRYSQRDAPQPVLAWAHGPHETRVAFDRPLDPDQLRDLGRRIAIENGRHVGAGDRFEAFRPGYQVVADQMNLPRFDLPVHAVQVTPDRRTLVLTTGRQEQAGGYGVALPGFGRAEQPERDGELPQVPAIDLRYDLCGVEAVWKSDDGASGWTGWLPHLDLAVSRELTRGSATHAELWALLARPGRLTLRTKLNLWHMLRPAVQPGSSIDYEWPEERVTLEVSSPAKVNVKFAAAGIETNHAHRERNRAIVAATITPRSDEPVPLEVTLSTGEGQASLSVAWHTSEDARPRALPLERLLLPWSVTESESAPPARRDIRELAGGRWAAGRQVFFSEQAGCAKCHAIHGRGSQIGPDLSNLVHRDYASVLRDVTEPSFAINPDYITYTVALNSGKIVTGTLRTEGDLLHIGDAEGRVTSVRRDDVNVLQPSNVSTMPGELTKAIGPERLRDLMTFLLTAPPRMPEYGPGTPPVPRSRAEVEAVLAGGPEASTAPRPLQIVLVAGAKDHGPGEHDYPAWQTAWKELLGVANEVEVSTADGWPSAPQLQTADVLVFYQRGTWTPERAADIDAHLARGGGLVYIHYAVDGGPDPAGFAERIGLASQGGRSRFRHGPLELHFDRGSQHPIARNFGRVAFHDESYWQLAGDRAKIGVLATGMEEGQPQPLFWTTEPGRGRVFVSILGHYSWTFDDPLFRVLLLRGIAWTAREPVDRFNELVTIGARLAEK
ncbi:MAG TPA: ThuA domain-containing protein [Planctomycetaceae bacterium]|nr:ThuA domain-containing protein [Planctomycetaceae bacterium]